MGVEVSVGLLSLLHVVDELVHEAFELGVGLECEGVADGLDELGDVGVPVDVGRVGVSGLPVELPGVDASGVLALLVFDAEGGLAVDLLAFGPEAAGDADAAQGKWL